LWSSKKISSVGVYEKMGFTEPRGLIHEVHGYSLKLVEYRRAISPFD